MKAVVCTNIKGQIGLAGKELLYEFSEDKKHFREVTNGGIVIMGRKTYETIPDGILKNRTNIVLSSSHDFHPVKGVIIARSLYDLGRKLMNADLDNVFVIGGSSIYNQLVPFCESVDMTFVMDEGYDTASMDVSVDYFPFFTSIFEQTPSREKWDVLIQGRHIHLGEPYPHMFLDINHTNIINNIMEDVVRTAGECIPLAQSYPFLAGLFGITLDSETVSKEILEWKLLSKEGSTNN